MYQFTYVYFAVATLEVTNLLYKNIKQDKKEWLKMSQYWKKDANKQVLRSD